MNKIMVLILEGDSGNPPETATVLSFDDESSAENYCYNQTKYDWKYKICKIIEESVPTNIEM